MPELPEVETVRRNLEATILGRTIRRVRLSGLRLREPVARGFSRRLVGRTVERVDRHGKYLLFRFDQRLTVLSHLGMSGRWLFFDAPPSRLLPHVHARFEFADQSELWFQDPRRFGLLRSITTGDDPMDPALRILGPDPVSAPLGGVQLEAAARKAKVAVKNFLLDQKKVAGIGNIYASEILHRAAVDPRRRAGSLTRSEWEAVAAEVSAVLGEAIERMGTTLSTYRTLWNEPGTYGDVLRVYDRAGEACRRCGTPIRRIVQGQRSTYFCPGCQRRSGSAAAAGRGRRAVRRGSRARKRA